ncbi:MAG: hypothetical protein AAB320_03955 [Elusimicrobiota bacterium]
MARPHFKKRRQAAGPNKNEQKVMRSEDDKARGRTIMGPRFPFVKRLNLNVTFMSPQGAMLEEKSLSFGPLDSYNFAFNCPGRCGGGSYDLSMRLEAIVSSRVTETEIVMKCPQPVYAGAAEACACELRAKLSISYLPPPAAAAPDAA